MAQSNYDKLIKKTESIEEHQPIVGGVARDTIQSFGSGYKTAMGLMSGDKKKTKEGLKGMGKAIWDVHTMRAFRGVNKGIAPQYYGGSQEEAQALRDRNQERIDVGQGYVNQGARALTQAGHLAQDDRGQAYRLSTEGRGIAQSGISQQDQMLAAANQAAGTNVGSLAELQMRQAAQQNNNAMLAQAALARGGNQAAAMRMAQAQASQNNLTNNQNIGMMRLQEDQDRQNRILTTNQAAAQAMGQRAQLGMGAQSSALGLANNSTQTYGQLGTSLGQLGNQNLGQYLGAESTQNQAQLNFDTEKARSNKAGQGGVLGIASNLVGSILGKG